MDLSYGLEIRKTVGDFSQDRLSVVNKTIMLNPGKKLMRKSFFRKVPLAMCMPFSAWLFGLTSDF